jgi:tRNA G18 (ribose-2'-O)-methylase SpoU
MIAIQFNLNEIKEIEVATKYANAVREKYPTEDVLLLPDGITLLQLDDENLGSIIRSLVDYAKLKGIDF